MSEIIKVVQHFQKEKLTQPRKGFLHNLHLAALPYPERAHKYSNLQHLFLQTNTNALLIGNRHIKFAIVIDINNLKLGSNA